MYSVIKQYKNALKKKAARKMISWIKDLKKRIEAKKRNEVIIATCLRACTNEVCMRLIYNSMTNAKWFSL